MGDSEENFVEKLDLIVCDWVYSFICKMLMYTSGLEFGFLLNLISNKFIVIVCIYHNLVVITSEHVLYKHFPLQTWLENYQIIGLI